MTITIRSADSVINMALKLESMARRLRAAGNDEEANELMQAAASCGNAGRMLRSKTRFGIIWPIAHRDYY